MVAERRDFPLQLEEAVGENRRLVGLVAELGGDQDILRAVGEMLARIGKDAADGVAPPVLELRRQEEGEASVEVAGQGADVLAVTAGASRALEKAVDKDVDQQRGGALGAYRPAVHHAALDPVEARHRLRGIDRSADGLKRITIEVGELRARRADYLHASVEFAEIGASFEDGEPPEIYEKATAFWRLGIGAGDVHARECRKSSAQHFIIQRDREAVGLFDRMKIPTRKVSPIERLDAAVLCGVKLVIEAGRDEIVRRGNGNRGRVGGCHRWGL